MFDNIKIIDNGKGTVYRIADRKREPTYISVERFEDIPMISQKPWSKQHSHEFYFLMWFFKGSGTDVIDFKEYPITANKVFTLAPGQLHQCKDLRDFEGVVVTFSADFLNNVNREVREIIRQQVFSSSQDVSPVYEILDHDIAHFKEDIKRIADAIRDYKDCVTKKYYLASLLSLFLLDLYNYGGEKKTRNS